jgi:hypothetical protein
MMIIIYTKDLTGSILMITVRAALVHYLLRTIGIDPNFLHGKPTAQQVIIDNLSSIEQWLFK